MEHNNSYNAENIDEVILSDSERQRLNKLIHDTSLSEIVIYFLIAALAMDVRYLQLLRGQTSDTLNNTDFYKDVGNVNILAISANRVYIVGTFYFLWLNYSSYLAAINSADTEESEKINAWQTFIASLLIFIATVLSGSNLSL